METFVCIIAIIIFIIILKAPSYRAQNRVAPKGKSTDFHQMTIDRNLNNMSQRDIDIKFNKGGYDIPSKNLNNKK